MREKGGNSAGGTRDARLPFAARGLSGCAPKLYNVNMRYQPTKAIPPAVTDGRKYSLTVASFIDAGKWRTRF